MEDRNVGAKNRSIVDEAKKCIDRKEWKIAISLFQESRTICLTQDWPDGVRYANEMIAKATSNLQDSLPLLKDLREYCKKIRIICPICNKTGALLVDKNIGSRALEEHNALIKLRIFPGDICEHEFTVFVDDTFKMRS